MATDPPTGTGAPATVGTDPLTLEQIATFMTDITREPLPASSGGHGLLKDKVAVITGAGRGIGAITARLFVDEGAKVLIADVSGHEHDTAAELGENAVAFHVDMTREEDIEAMFARALEVFGRVDVLVNIAGNPGGKRGDELTVEEYESITQVHLRGTLLVDKHAVRVVAPNGGGAIVNFSSAASFAVDEKISFAYSSSKAGINAATRSYAVHYGKQGIRVNAVAPGFTLSEKNRNIPAVAFEQLSAKAALGRPGTPIEQAQVAAFLASDLASFVTGVVVPVDGGWSSRLA
ncbi:SDR family NAD(P)-dependent oxidoreductase [Brevibacterium zhoupengii]|uniref:SDR family NAD(P)-dependent oxidoreductase n=1 Tax=Brevibacterium zhoupengii TaxID=2898795 RepID=UPI001E2F2E0C|nr:SDR family oxidoreductase [Brevibacterium zhoupengii]